MSTRNHYDEDFKRTLVELYHNGKTQASLIKEYGVSQSALTKGITIERNGDTTKLDKALREVNKETRTDQRQLSEVERALKMDPRNTDLRV